MNEKINNEYNKTYFLKFQHKHPYTHSGTDLLYVLADSLSAKIAS